MLDRSLLEGDAPTVAPQLLNKLLTHGGTIGRIVEVEAYTPDDPASHSVRGRTPRNSTMFEQAGTLYCYLSYGVHVCANVAVDAVGTGAAVLLRALDPVHGIEEMRARRAGRHDLADGPGKLCQALDIRLEHDGVDLLDPASPIGLSDDGVPPPKTPVVGTRIGISVARGRPWRWRVDPAQRQSIQ
ncbi:MAG: DNA-3-methyladenine glycosylase [Actinomycetota bacterium]